MIDEKKIREVKLDKLMESGVLAYPSRTKRTHKILDALSDFNKLAAAKKTITLAGRLKTLRLHGGSCFADLEDGSGKIQIYFKKDVLGRDYEIVQELLDIGDFIEASGFVFITKKGEKTLEAAKFKILTKTLLPLPEKWHGLSDIEIRYRQRYLDLIANPEIKEIFIKRNKIIKAIREFLDSHNFLEVETPILQPLYGGAAARPFKTHYNALKHDFYLRIAPELYLKRLVVGGLERVYEIARCFRNEGIDRSHNPEFTQVEFYQAYQDYLGLMELTEQMFTHLLTSVEGNLEITYEKQKVNFTPPYPRLTFADALKKHAQIDIKKIKEKDDLIKAAKRAGVEIDKKWRRSKILDEFFKELVRPKLIQPVFITDHPIELSPLAKQKANEPEFTERFQLIAAGIELVNAFSELNDPLEQEKRFLEQQKNKDEEAHPLDKDFIEALKHGMPPTAGFGMGIDRLAMLLTGAHNIKEVILFPTLKPKA